MTSHTTWLEAPATGPDAACAFVDTHLRDLTDGSPVAASPRFRGGQAAADGALASFDVTGYASRRNEVAPEDRRGASALSPWIRHGLLDLPTVWDAVAGGPSRDVRKFRDELLWQEYARHWYARLGTRTRRGVRSSPPADTSTHVWDRSMVCIDETVGELETDGWLVNQTRMWLASHWTVRHHADWRAGDDEFFRHLLDGSRAANRLGWQWTTGAGSSKAYGFSRWQVEKRTRGWCARCPHGQDCPIDSWPDDPELAPVDRPVALRRDPDPAATAGPVEPEIVRAPDAVWLTAESLGDDDPALAAHPDLPVRFVFDAPLLRRLALHPKRLVFLVESLAELAEHRDLAIAIDDPAVALAGTDLAVTFAPVPGFRRLRSALEPVAVHPWRWLARPRDGSVSSFSAWRTQVGR